MTWSTVVMHEHLPAELHVGNSHIEPLIEALCQASPVGARAAQMCAQVAKTTQEAVSDIAERRATLHSGKTDNRKGTERLAQFKETCYNMSVSILRTIQ